MKRIFIVLFATILISSSWTYHAKAAEEYRISPGDVLIISVWGYEELQAKELLVRDDGKIAFPLAGGDTSCWFIARELMQDIAHALHGYINNPQVTVNIFKYHTTRIYVVGEVARPGLYELEKQHNLMDAITVAGSYTKDAAKKKVFIISQGNTSNQVEVNLLQLLRKGDMTQNVSLKDGDVVYRAEQQPH